jgi:phosphoribosylaminoimidazole (AIR) synthetase
MKSLDYSSAGVNVIAGDAASAILHDAAKRTWANRKGRLGEVHNLQAHFRSSRYFRVPQAHEGLCFGVNFDGLGTKVEGRTSPLLLESGKGPFWPWFVMTLQSRVANPL